MVNSKVTINNISNIIFEYKFDAAKSDTLYDKLKTIKNGEFLSEITTSQGILVDADSILPTLTMEGRGFEIFIHSNAIKLVISKISRSKKLSSISLSSLKEILVQSYLNKINVDFNTIVGWVLGVLHIDEKNIKFKMHVNTTPNIPFKKNNINAHCGSELKKLFGVATKVSSIGVTFNEPSDDSKKLSFYVEIPNEPKQNVEFISGTMTMDGFKFYDLHTLLNDELKSINKFITKAIE